MRKLAENPNEPRYGYDLMKAAKVSSGTLYPMLYRLEQEGLLTSGWANLSNSRDRPRKYYQLTAHGVFVAKTEFPQAIAKSDSEKTIICAPAPRVIA